MPGLAAVHFSAFELEDHNLVAAGLVYNRSHDAGPRHYRLPNSGFVIAAHQKNIFKGDLVTDFAVQFLHAQQIPGRYPILLAATLNDCVHGSSS